MAITTAISGRPGRWRSVTVLRVHIQGLIILLREGETGCCVRAPGETEHVYKRRNKWWGKKTNSFNLFVQRLRALLLTDRSALFLCLV